MYGAEERVAEMMKQAGYTQFYTNSIYGQLKRDDIPKKCIESEHTIIETLKEKYKKEIAKTLKTKTQ
jgi:hypothetical protein